MAKAKAKATEKLWCVDRRQTVLLAKKLATRGEGSVYTCNLRHYLAKVYREPAKQDFKKLRYMISHPPRDPTKQTRGHISIAWPSDLLMSDGGKPVGFIMPFIRHGLPLVQIYNRRHRKRVAPGFNWKYLHVTAYNIALILEALHENDYVVGDIQSQNMLVNKQAMVSVIDTDSFQVTIENGTVYRCPVGAAGFTPPELLGKNLREVDRNRHHDCFGLAVLIHQLLLGYHPYSGKWTGAGHGQLTVDDFIRRGDWAADQKGQLRRGRWCLPFEIVAPQLQTLFYRAFSEGHDDPRRRPSPEEWRDALKEAIDGLLPCPASDQHFYHPTTSSCWRCAWDGSLHSADGPSIRPLPNQGKTKRSTAPVQSADDSAGKGGTASSTASSHGSSPATARASTIAAVLTAMARTLSAAWQGLRATATKVVPHRRSTWCLLVVTLAGAASYWHWYPASDAYLRTVPHRLHEVVYLPAKAKLTAYLTKQNAADQVIRQYVGHLDGGNYEQAFSLLTVDYREALAKKGLTIDRFTSYWQRYGPVSIRSLTVTATTATEATIAAELVLANRQTGKTEVGRYEFSLHFDQSRQQWLIGRQRTR